MTRLLAYQLITNIVNYSFDTYTEKYKRTKAMELILNTIKAKQETIEELKKTTNESYQESIKEKSEKIIASIRDKKEVKDYKESQFNELQTRIQFSLNEMTKLIEEGLEVYNTIPKTEPLLQLPDFKNKKKLLEQKLLENNPIH